MMHNTRAEKVRYEDPDYGNPKLVDRTPNMHRRSPIIVTLGDPKITPVDIQKLMELGVNGIRLKTSQCTTGDKIKLIGKVDKATATLCKKHSVLDWPMTTCVELKTCIVRTGVLEGEEQYITVKEGTHVVLSNNIEEFDKCTATRIFVDNPYIAVDVKVGMLISIAQDEIELRCKKIIDDNSIGCVVTKTGRLGSMNLFAVRGSKKSRPVLTKSDLQIVRFALQYQVDMIIVNYARRAETIQKLKAYIGKTVRRPFILAGICTSEGLKNIDDVIKEADGILFSREFLAFELEESLRYRMTLIQKWAGAKCQQAGKPFYISGSIFRRALVYREFADNETMDVANAILDGATGFLLKDCPDIEVLFEVIKELNEVCCTVEPLTSTKTDFRRIVDSMPMPINAAQACAMSCAAVAHQVNARVIVIPTVTGYTASILMWLRPACLVLTVSSKTSTTRRLQSYRCVTPLKFDKAESFKNWGQAIESRVQLAVQHAVKEGWLEYGNSYVTLQRGTEKSAFCDTVKAWIVTISKKTSVECEVEVETKESRRHL